ncbi:MAG: DUF1501 domain-containing protein [Planctomycetota bacterium]
MTCRDHLLSRRNLLTVGAFGGLTLCNFFRIRSVMADQKNYESKEGTAKSVIFIFLPGGIAHQESFDPKPYAPLEYRGPLNSIETSLPGVRFSELFPQMAKIANKTVVCRSMTHGEAAHERGTHNMFTGYRPSPALQYPSMGSVVAHEFGPRNNLPPYVLIPSLPTPYAGTGYLSSSYAGFSLGADPANEGFRVQDLALPGGVDETRFTRRQKLLDVVNEHFKQREKSDSMEAVDTFYERAYGLIGSPAAREAFDISKEDAAIRDAYGRNQAGSRMLLARRLVEAGVRFVTLTYGGWDHHDNIAGAMRGQVPPFDQALATLINDLDSRGLLDSTLVCVGSEFGRTPKINATAGRDHWPKVFSLLMAGGGLKRGLAWGTSDATASEPDQDPLTVDDWAPTVYHMLGIVADKELMAPGNRPIEIVDGGKVLKDLLA